MSIYPELDSLDLNGLVNRFDGRDPDEGEKNYDPQEGIYYEEVARSIIKHGDPGYQYLLSKINDVNTPRLRGILAALGSTEEKKQEVQDLLVPFLRDGRPSIVAEAIEGLRRLRVDAVSEQVMALTSDSPHVRSAVLRYAAGVFGDEAASTLIAALSDSHPIVRQSAADEVGELCIVSALPGLTTLLHDPDPDVREAAKTAIETIEAC